MESNTGFLLATLNAFLNGTSAVLLGLGFWAVKKKKIETHRRLMVSTFLVSVLFLVSYLTRFYLTGVHRYPGEGPMKTFYLTLLGSHTLLAAVTPFLAIRTLFLGWKGRIKDHRRIARWTFPIWMYVSVTGVMVYLLLYH